MNEPCIPLRNLIAGAPAGVIVLEPGDRLKSTFGPEVDRKQYTVARIFPGEGTVVLVDQEYFSHIRRWENLRGDILTGLMEAWRPCGAAGVRASTTQIQTHH